MKPINRRSFLAAAAFAQAPRDWSGKSPLRYPDPDIVVLDKRFAKYKIGNTPIQRLYTGTLWAEGPAWSGAGRYLLWSDIPNNRQMRWIEEDGHVSVFRNPSGYSNGNTFDWEGRQISCEHGNRRVVRYEASGRVTVLADKWKGKPFNAPNDVVVHPDPLMDPSPETEAVEARFKAFLARFPAARAYHDFRIVAHSEGKTIIIADLDVDRSLPDPARESILEEVRKSAAKAFPELAYPVFSLTSRFSY